MKPLCVFTAEYNGTGSQLDLLRASCERVGITLQTYGQGRNWPGWLLGKTRDGAEFLESMASEFEYAMWADGYDSLVLEPETVILSTYAAVTGGDFILLAAERNCWPDQELAEFFPHASGKRYVNAGGYMGPTRLLAEEMRKVLTCVTTENDQEAWAIHYLEKYPSIQLDHESRVFMSMGDGDTGTKSCVRHWNGNTPGREEYWRKLCV